MLHGLTFSSVAVLPHHHILLHLRRIHLQAQRTVQAGELTFIFLFFILRM